jgi:hypothetical protein
MALVVPPTLHQTLQTNLTAASRAGTTITASATPHAKGTWQSLLDPTSRPSVGMYVRGRVVSSSAAVANYLLDVGYGPTGGGSEQVVIPNLGLGAATNSTGGKSFFFPISIPSGVRVSARAQATIVSDTAVVAIWLAQHALYPSAAGPVQDYGTNLATSHGASVTPGSGAFGAWAQLTASTSRAHRFWAAVMDQLADTTIVTAEVLVELGIGPDASNVTTIFGPLGFLQGNAETIDSPFPMLGYAPVPAGTRLWARIASAEAEARGVIAYGID